MRVDDVVIVGAGPAGLAAAATLRARGIDTTIIERGRVGEPWRSRYDRLHLHTIRSLSHLPGYRIPREFGRWVARDQFVQYLEQYAAHHRLEPRFGEGPRVLTAITATGASARLLARFPRGWSWWPLDIPAFHICPMAWHIRWAGGSFGGIPQSAAVSRPGRAHCWCRQQRHRDCRRSCRGGARQVRIAIRTPPNILRRDVKGFPIQLLGIVFRRLPTQLLDPLILVLRRATIPDLSAFGLPRRSAPFSQFRRTGTVPIFDVGFIDAVRSGVIEVVPGVTALDGRAVVLADGSRVSPDAVVAATGYQPGLAPLVGHLTAIGEHGIPDPHPNLRATARSWRGCPTHCRRRGARTWRLEATSHCHRELGRWGCWELEHNPGSGDCDREEPWQGPWAVRPSVVDPRDRRGRS